MEIVKAAKEKVDKTVTFFKKVLGVMMAWGLVFSLVTIGGLRVAFDYDDTLVFSAPAYAKAFKSGTQPFSPQFWETVNTSYDLESRKIVSNALAWVFRVFGFRITILADRASYGGQALKKEWRHLASNFVFIGDKGSKTATLQSGTYVMYFGDRDSSISDGRRARVLTLRIKRSPRSTNKEDYHPGTMGELVVPVSDR
jgi:acid phosphatase class B